MLLLFWEALKISLLELEKCTCNKMLWRIFSDWSRNSYCISCVMSPSRTSSIVHCNLFNKMCYTMALSIQQYGILRHMDLDLCLSASASKLLSYLISLSLNFPNLSENGRTLNAYHFELPRKFSDNVCQIPNSHGLIWGCVVAVVIILTPTWDSLFTLLKFDSQIPRELFNKVLFSSFHLY